jgi:hypothetical protein
MSWFARVLGRNERLCRLVQSSQHLLPVVAALLVPGCLIEEPPVWNSKPSPPVLMHFTPATGTIVAIWLGDTKTFEFAESSDDLGRPLVAAWYRDYGLPTEKYFNYKTIAAGSANVLKDISVSWGPDQPMCASFTIMVTHAGNDDNSDSHHPIDETDVAFATWWVNVANDPFVLSGCTINGGGTSQ